jgi:hypothetical protein
VWWCEGEDSEEGECDADFVLDLELDPKNEPSEDDVDARLAQLRHPGRHPAAAKAAAGKAAASSPFVMPQMDSWLDLCQLEEQQAADHADRVAMAKAKRQGNHGEASIVYISDEETDKAKKRKTSSA